MDSKQFEKYFKKLDFIEIITILFIFIGIYLFIFPSNEEVTYSESISFDRDNNLIQDLNLFFEYTSENDFVIGRPINVQIEIYKPFDGDNTLFNLLRNQNDIDIIFSFPNSNYYLEENKYVKGVKLNPKISNFKYFSDKDAIIGNIIIYYNTQGEYSPDLYLKILNQTTWMNLDKIRLKVNSNNSEKSILINQKIYALTLIIIGLTIINFRRKKNS